MNYMKLYLILLLFILSTNGFQIKYSPKNFPKISYTRIHDISYKKPLVYRKKKSFTFTLINNIFLYINNTFLPNINNQFNNKNLDTYLDN